MNTNDFQFHKDTAPAVESAIRTLYANQHRARFFFGDSDTGRDWMEENDVLGTVGKSTGPQPCALLIHNSRSVGGGNILTHCVVRIIDTVTGRKVYRHPTYHAPALDVVEPSDLPDYKANVTKDGEVYARCHSLKSAKNLYNFLLGNRFAK